MPPNVLFSVDLKGSKANNECAWLVYNQIKKYGMENRVLWGSSNTKVHAYLSELDPDIAKYYTKG